MLKGKLIEDCRARLGAKLNKFYFFQADDGIRDHCVTGVQTCALPIFGSPGGARGRPPHAARPETSTSAKAHAGAEEHAAESRAKRHGVGSRPERYLVAVAPPTEGRSLAAQLDQDPKIRVVRTIGRPGVGGGYPHIAVIETTAERAAVIARTPTLYVEPNQGLGWGTALRPDLGDMPDPAAAPVGEGQPGGVDGAHDRRRPVEG